MNEAIQTWINAAAASPAVEGCGVRASGAFHVKSRRPEMTEAKITEAMKQLFDAMYFLQQNQFLTDRLRWTFDGGQLHCASGRGGVSVVLVAAKDAPEAEIERLLASCPLLQAG
jgi:hypothetical protein